MVQGLTRELIALRVARELRDGMVVNLGIGLPTLVSNFLPPGEQILLQAEDGINRLTRRLVSDLTRAIYDLAEASHPLVIAGNEKFFSAGADLREIARLVPVDALEFARVRDADLEFCRFGLGECRPRQHGRCNARRECSLEQFHRSPP